MFEKDHFTAGFNAGIYRQLFGLDPPEIFALYSSMSKEEIRNYAKERFASWTQEDNEAVFGRGKPG